jgi:hypothetical protein
MAALSLVPAPSVPLPLRRSAVPSPTLEVLEVRPDRRNPVRGQQQLAFHVADVRWER